MKLIKSISKDTNTYNNIYNKEIYTQYMDLLNVNYNNMYLLEKNNTLTNIDNFNDDKIDMLDTLDTIATPSKKQKYYEFNIDTLEQLTKNDKHITTFMNHLQANDNYTSTTTGLSPLQSILGYKPSIFNIVVGTNADYVSDEATRGEKKLYEPKKDNNDKDNSMVYLFLDVLNYYKNNTKDIKELIK